MDQDRTRRSPEDCRFAEFPALAKLRLVDGDLDELADQGFLAQERRRDCAYYKLRFRRGGRQIVRYVGGANEAAVITEELKKLRAGCRLRRELRALDCSARQMLRDSKSQLEPLLVERGFRFHGRAIRQPRASRPQINVTFP
jgi:hypothetical protein